MAITLMGGLSLGPLVMFGLIPVPYDVLFATLPALVRRSQRSV
jgi:hypothetical protein|nr:hypothetical protein [Pseudomonas pharyngis]